MRTHLGGGREGEAGRITVPREADHHHHHHHLEMLREFEKASGLNLSLSPCLDHAGEESIPLLDLPC